MKSSNCFSSQYAVNQIVVCTVILKWQDISQDICHLKLIRSSAYNLFEPRAISVYQNISEPSKQNTATDFYN